jgi:hypothetical protein
MILKTEKGLEKEHAYFRIVQTYNCGKVHNPIRLKRGFIMSLRDNSTLKEDHLCKGRLHRKDIFQITIISFSRLGNEKGSNHWKDIG